MNWWQRMCLSTAVSFFTSLRFANAKVKTSSIPIAKEVLENIKIAFSDEPEVMAYFK
jgi:hypothetical protein